MTDPQRAQQVEKAFTELHRLGWSIGETGGPGDWIVSGSNGEHEIHAAAATQWEAWQQALEQADAMPAALVEG